MGRQKAEIRVAAAHDIGVRMEDMLDEARAEVERMRGARLALVEAAKKLEEHLQVVGSESDQGKLDPEHVSLVKRYVNQCGGIVRNLATGAEAKLLIAQGKVAGLEQSVKEVKRAHDAARAKVAAFERGDLVEEEEGDQTVGAAADRPVRVVGEHPGDPLEGRREKPEPAKVTRRGRRRTNRRAPAAK